MKEVKTLRIWNGNVHCGSFSRFLRIFGFQQTTHFIAWYCIRTHLITFVIADAQTAIRCTGSSITSDAKIHEEKRGEEGIGDVCYSNFGHASSVTAIARWRLAYPKFIWNSLHLKSKYFCAVVSERRPMDFFEKHFKRRHLQRVTDRYQISGTQIARYSTLGDDFY